MLGVIVSPARTFHIKWRKNLLGNSIAVERSSDGTKGQLRFTQSYSWGRVWCVCVSRSFQTILGVRCHYHSAAVRIRWSHCVSICIHFRHHTHTHRILHASHVAHMHVTHHKPHTLVKHNTHTTSLIITLHTRHLSHTITTITLKFPTFCITHTKHSLYICCCPELLCVSSPWLLFQCFQT